MTFHIRRSNPEFQSNLTLYSLAKERSRINQLPFGMVKANPELQRRRLEKSGRWKACRFIQKKKKRFENNGDAVSSCEFDKEGNLWIWT